MERRKRTLLTYWLTLIVGTVVVSAGITWLVMNVGAQGMPDVIESGSEVAIPPKIVFDKGQNLQIVGGNVRLEADKCVVDKSSTVVVHFKNEGMGKLRLQLSRTSCECITEIKVNGEVVEKGRNWVETAPGQSGAISFSWKPKKDQLREPNLRLSAEFQINDPEPYYSNGLRLEIQTLLSAE